MKLCETLSILIVLLLYMVVSLLFFLSIAKADYYNSYEKLSENEELNEDYIIIFENRRSNITIFAIHGGGIEPGTSEPAKDLADELNLSYYLFEGIKSSNNQLLHITSVNFDEPIGRSLAKNSKSALSIHGNKGDEPVIYLGGRDEIYKNMLRYSLQTRGFQVEDAPAEIDGMSKANIVNDTKLKAGAQLELTEELRKSFFENHDWSKKNRVHTTVIYAEFMKGLKEATHSYKLFLKKR
ncbi:poly-gamma-glutamate hydrolase family protein [Alteribacillus sp. HJP-4]|uniref:poly-gamma-glutamate hydrolase family protein n=1 Tax=Alteribacillus sp. HJP-4 TaxID=2775394 RepID=UPI0035CCE9EB